MNVMFHMMVHIFAAGCSLPGLEENAYPDSHKRKYLIGESLNYVCQFGKFRNCCWVFM